MRSRIARAGVPSTIACTSRSRSRTILASSCCRSMASLCTCWRRRLVSAVNSSQKAAKRVGSISRVDNAFSTRASSASRAMVRRFVQVPLLRAAEQPMWVAETIDMPLPQTPQVTCRRKDSAGDWPARARRRGCCRAAGRLSPAGFSRGPEIVRKNAQPGHLGGDPGRARVGAGDPPAGGRVLNVAQPVPDQAADVELIVQDAGAAAGCRNCRGAPGRRAARRSARALRAAAIAFGDRPRR